MSMSKHHNGSSKKSVDPLARRMHFDAVAGNQKVAEPLQAQANDTLWPLLQYIQAAVRHEYKRQDQCALPWSPVPAPSTYELLPVDALVRVTLGPDRYEVVEGAEHVLRDPSLPILVDWRHGVAIEDVACEGHHVFIVPASPLGADADLSIGGARIAVELVAQPVPSRLTSPSGRAFDGELVHTESGGGRRLAVRDGGATGDLRADHGVVLEPLDPFTDLRFVLDGTEQLRPTGSQLTVEATPSAELLVGNNGVRYRWRATGATSKLRWIQLELPSDGAPSADHIDPRAAFVADKVDEVWTAKHKHDGAVLRVRRVDHEQYRLALDTLPAGGSKLYAPRNTKALHLQQAAIERLRDAPLPHHQGLLRLCEHPDRVRWPRLRPAAPSNWFVLTEPSRDGTDQQRAFVARALGGLGTALEPGAGDFTLLEGPPGSGKTTAICELVLQLAARNKRVLLCGSTHASIDNVIERLHDRTEPVDIVRVGHADRIDAIIERAHFDRRVDELLAQWQEGGGLAGECSDEQLRAAERVIADGADLTCGTTVGITNHPYFRQTNGRPCDQTMPMWDVLIVDEASKTTIQEFLVPALMARRWVVVGDVQQLPPFADQNQIIANLRDWDDPLVKGIAPADHQRACFLLWTMTQSEQARHARSAPAVLCEPSGVLDAFEEEWRARELEDRVLVRLANHRGGGRKVGEVLTVDDVLAGASRALLLDAADVILVPAEQFDAIAHRLPGDVALLRDPKTLSSTHPQPYRHQYWLDAGTREKGQLELLSFAEREDWAKQIAWRVNRRYEQGHTKDTQAMQTLARAIEGLLPAAGGTRVADRVAQVADIGLPSILEVLQHGVGEGRSRRRAALTGGFEGPSFDERFLSLTFQHRMRPEISAFPRQHVYAGKALRDANTIQLRDEHNAWDFVPSAPGNVRLEQRCAWLDVRGKEEQGKNVAEVQAMEALVRQFLAWAAQRGAPERVGDERWQLACLSFYTGQVSAVRDMLRRVTGQGTRESRFSAANVSIVCGTVDRFQGREADMVLLSMRNHCRTGFLNSLNRLNVALTRAREQLIVIGHAEYFGRCRVAELEALTQHLPITRFQTQPPRSRRGRS